MTVADMIIDLSSRPHIKSLSYGPVGGIYQVRAVIECPGCHKQATWYYPGTEFEQWVMGALIQDVLKDSSAASREALVSGMCNQCLDKMGDG